MKPYNSLSKILDDRTSGSSEILIKINDYLKKNLNDTNLIKQSLDVIKKRMINFQAVMQYEKDIRKFIFSGDKEALKKFIDEFEVKYSNSHHMIYQNIKPLLKNKRIVFTLSNSQTVFEIIKLWNEENKKIKVIIAESRPKFEGRILAKQLLRLGISVTLIPDFQSAEYIAKSDIILIGADKVMKNGDVVNKIGSKCIAILAKYINKPFMVISSAKKMSKAIKFKDTAKTPSEIWKYRHPKLKIENYYFEVVPRNLIKKIITDKGHY